MHHRLPSVVALRRDCQFLSLGAVLLGAFSRPLLGAEVDLPRYPTLSPDGSTVVFSWRGDLWKAPSGGGAAVRLTSHPAEEERAQFSRDGALIAFESERDGFRNLWVMRPDGAGLQQVSRLDGSAALSDFAVGSDGKPVLMFDAAIENDLYRSSRPYRLGLEGGQPIRTLDAFGSMATLSPDGTRILFERGGSSWSRRGYVGPDQRDVWLFDANDGSFRRLTDHPGNDGLARWIGDDEFVFLSDRGNGTVNLFRQSVAPGAVARPLTGFTNDGDTGDIHGVTVGGGKAIVASWDALYEVDLDGRGSPRKLAFTAPSDSRDDLQLKAIGRDVTDAALSPDGQTMAVIAFGDVWVRGTADKSMPRRVTDGLGREVDLAWSPDGLTLYWASDRDGGWSIYGATVEKTRDEIRKRTDERLKPPVAKEEKKEGGKAESKEAGKEEAPAADPKPATEPGAATAPVAAEPPVEPSSEPKPTPEPKTESKSDAKADAKADTKKDPLLDPARWADAISFTVAPVVHDAHDDTRPSPSPDGTRLAFRRGLGTLVVRDLASGDERTLLENFDTGLEWRWSPDSKLIAYETSDRNFNSDIWIVPADGSVPAVNVTRHPDNDGSPRWSADGKALAFLSERTNEEVDVWFVFLDRDLEGLKGQDLDKYFKDAAEAVKKRKPLEPKAKASPKPAAKPAETTAETTPETTAGAAAQAATGDAGKPAEAAPEQASVEPTPASPFADLELDDAYLRVRRVTTLPGNEGNMELLPTGERIVFSGREGTMPALFTVRYDGTGQTRIAGPGRVTGVNLAGDRLTLVNGGSAATLGVSGGEAKNVDVSETIEVDLSQLSSQKFLEAMRVLGTHFYHPTMKGLDWDALTARYHELAKRARTPDEFDWVANRMLGELNASHMGVRSPSPSSELARPQGRLGTRLKPVEGGYEVTAILPQSPAALAKVPLAIGDIITAIDFEPFATGQTVEERLAGKAGKEVIVTVRRTPPDAAEPLTLDLLVTPVSGGEIRRLSYVDTTLRNRALVDGWSNGTIGYIHIQGMDQASLDEFERDLYASAEGKKGLLIDVRNNGGGSTADLLLASIMVQPHAYTIARGGDASWRDGYPQDRLFIQRYPLPINMLCNEKSFSNAEIVSHAFKTLKRGTLVGQQTYGGVISTGGTSLLDGTTVRLPFRGWYLPDGTDMENNGAIPDLLVPQTPEDEVAGNDAQLKAATEDLLKRIGG
jgi:tricorn protease